MGAMAAAPRRVAFDRAAYASEPAAACIPVSASRPGSGAVLLDALALAAAEDAQAEKDTASTAVRPKLSWSETTSSRVQ